MRMKPQQDKRKRRRLNWEKLSDQVLWCHLIHSFTFQIMDLTCFQWIEEGVGEGSRGLCNLEGSVTGIDKALGKRTDIVLGKRIDIVFGESWKDWEGVAAWHAGVHAPRKFMRTPDLFALLFCFLRYLLHTCSVPSSLLSLKPFPKPFLQGR
jgi:hypothetical protein